MNNNNKLILTFICRTILTEGYIVKESCRAFSYIDIDKTTQKKATPQDIVLHFVLNTNTPGKVYKKVKES